MTTQQTAQKNDQQILQKFVDTLDHWLTEEDIGLNMYGCVESNVGKHVHDILKLAKKKCILR